MKLSWKSILMTGIVVGMAGNLWGLLTCRWLFKWVYSVCSPELYRHEMLHGTFGWMVSMGASKILLGVLLALAYALVGRTLPGRRSSRGALFGILIWVLGLLPSKWSAFMSVSMPTGVFLYWVANDFVSSVLLGMLTAALYERGGAWNRLRIHARSALDARPGKDSRCAIPVPCPTAGLPSATSSSAPPA